MIRNPLSLTRFIKIASQYFDDEITGPSKGPRGRKPTITIRDCLMTVVALALLKYSSLNKFDKARQKKIVRKNLKRLFGINKIPSDTYLREMLEQLNPDEVKHVFTKLFSYLQRGKALEKYKYLDGRILIVNDGTESFSSKHVHCDKCCKRKNEDGSITYFHQTQLGVMVHPNSTVPIPVYVEPIVKEDGATKNDSELKASERSLRYFRKTDHNQKFVLVEDALYANGNHIKVLNEVEMDFIIVAKPGNNKTLFDNVEKMWNSSDCVSKREYSFIDYKGTVHFLRFVNHCTLNNSHTDVMVNFLEHRTVNKKGKEVTNSWITNILINEDNAYEIAQGGHARWQIEEVFNTLKNKGLCVELCAIKVFTTH